MASPPERLGASPRHGAVRVGPVAYSARVVSGTLVLAVGIGTRLLSPYRIGDFVVTIPSFLTFILNTHPTTLGVLQGT